MYNYFSTDPYTGIVGLDVIKATTSVYAFRIARWSVFVRNADESPQVRVSLLDTELWVSSKHRITHRSAPLLRNYWINGDDPIKRRRSIILFVCRKWRIRRTIGLISRGQSWWSRSFEYVSFSNISYLCWRIEKLGNILYWTIYKSEYISLEDLYFYRYFIYLLCKKYLMYTCSSSNY